MDIQQGIIKCFPQPMKSCLCIFVSLSLDSRKNTFNDSDITHRPNINLNRAGFQQIAQTAEITFERITFYDRNRN